MTQKDGLVLRARMEVLEQLRASMMQPGALTYFRKLRNFNFMVTTPAASLQKLRSAQPTPLCRALFLGDVPQASQSQAELFERLDAWVKANPDAQKMFSSWLQNFFIITWAQGAVRQSQSLNPDHHPTA